MQHPTNNIDYGFGSALALHEGTLAVGAPFLHFYNYPDSLPGKVFLYKFYTPLPQGLSSSEVGYNGNARSYISYEGNRGKYAISASGDNIGGTLDGFTYMHQSQTNEAEILVRLDQLDNSSQFNLVGLMAREGLDADAPNIFIGIDGGEKVIFQHRNTKGGQTNTFVGPMLPGAKWVKLRRAGNQFQTFVSQDGQSWDPFASVSLNLPSTLNYGVAVSSPISGQLIHVGLSQLKINGASY